MVRLTRWQRRTWLRLLLATLLLLLGVSLAGCAGSLFSATSSPTPVQVSASLSDSAAPTLSLKPGAGYGGIYVQVSGSHWPQNMMVLVTLEDAQGRTGTLASNNTDKAGNLTTGFLYPIDQRWLVPGPHQVVVTTADGSLEAKIAFTVVPPGTEATGVSSSSATVSTTVSTPKTTATVATGVISQVTTSSAHTINLPAVVAAPAAATPVVGENASVKQVKVDIAPGERVKSINCRSAQTMVTLAILSTPDFDAASVDPGSVTVAGRPLSAGEQGFDSSRAVLLPVAERVVAKFKDDRGENGHGKGKGPKPQKNPVPGRGLLPYSHHFQWRWYLKDVNDDGYVDLILQVHLGDTELSCSSMRVTLAGHTREGIPFQGSNSVHMIDPGRG